MPTGDSLIRAYWPSITVHTGKVAEIQFSVPGCISRRLRDVGRILGLIVVCYGVRAPGIKYRGSIRLFPYGVGQNAAPL